MFESYLYNKQKVSVHSESVLWVRAPESYGQFMDGAPLSLVIKYEIELPWSLLKLSPPGSV